MSDVSLWAPPAVGVDTATALVLRPARALSLEIQMVPKGKWRSKDSIVDPPATVETIARTLDEPLPWVAGVLSDLRFVLDRFVADDVTVLAPPFLVRRRGDPVWVALRDHLSEGHAGPEHFDDDHLADVLGLDVELVRRHPVVSESDVVGDLWGLRGLDLAAFDARAVPAVALATRLTAVVYSWLDLWNPEIHDYRTSRVGLERDFQNWLVIELDRLSRFDLPVELIRQEFQFLDKLKADVLCRATADCGPVRQGDLVVIENKVHMVDVEACDQLRRYVDRTKAEVALAGQQVHGVLIADGRTLELQQQLYNEGFPYISLSSLGYRDWLREFPELVAEEDGPDLVREATVATGSVPATSRPLPGEAAAKRRPKTGSWFIAGTEYSDRAAANKALSAHLGTYNETQWHDAQRLHGLR